MKPDDAFCVCCVMLVCTLSSLLCMVIATHTDDCKLFLVFIFQKNKMKLLECLSHACFFLQVKKSYKNFNKIKHEHEVKVEEVTIMSYNNSFVCLFINFLRKSDGLHVFFVNEIILRKTCYESHLVPEDFLSEFNYFNTGLADM